MNQDPSENPTPLLSETTVESVEHHFVFTGSGWDYFKIWLQNIALTVITLGIYGPWAKVRREQFFHSHTFLNDSSFEYTADPVSILKGRLLIVGFFVLYSIAFPVWKAVGIFLLMLLLPSIVTQVLRFRARYTSFRNIPFNFSGTHGAAAKQFILRPLGALFTLGILLPWATFGQRRFIVDNFEYGRSKFSFGGTLWGFYRVYLGAFGIILAPFLLFIAGAVFSVIAFGLPAVEATLEESYDYLIYFAIALYVVGLLVAAPLLKMCIKMITWNEARLENYSVHYVIPKLQYLWVLGSNVLLTLLTLGLASPYCAVRMHRFKISCLSLIGPESLDQFIGQRREALSALGDQAGDVGWADVDFGL